MSFGNNSANIDIKTHAVTIKFQMLFPKELQLKLFKNLMTRGKLDFMIFETQK